MQSLLNRDLQLFRLINYKWHNSVFDTLMPLFRNASFWYPLYLFLLLFVLINFKKNGGWWILFAALTVVLTNFISSDLIKEHIIRVRPCNEEAIADWVRVLVGYRPQSSSFTSSHATNHFGMAVFFFLTLRTQFSKWPSLFLIWAAIICYAQVYVGVHYPLDVISGAIIGILIGYLSANMFNKYFGLALPS
jgi:membrane-associated phospholipid phosphatase